VNLTERIANLLRSSITGFRATFCERLHIDGTGQEAILLSPSDFFFDERKSNS